MREWLPKLVGIERSVQLEIGTADGEGGGATLVVPAAVEASHEAQLTREAVTAAVHYVRIALRPAERAAFAAGPVRLAVRHPAYDHAAELSADTKASLLADWGDA